MISDQLQGVRDEVLRRADIAEHAERAGFRRRGRTWFCAFHENTRTPAASIKNGRVHCFGACARSWDVIDLTMARHGVDYVGALRILAQDYSIPFEDRQFTPAERADWGRRRRAAERQARPIGRAAWHFYMGRLSELEDAKRAAICGDHIDLTTLSAAARELDRLENHLTPEGLVREYLVATAEDPAGTAAIVATARAWDEACAFAVGAVVRQIEREQREAAPDANRT